MKNIFDLSTKTIILTGASGQLGSYYAQAFLDQGATVVSLDLERSESDLQTQKLFPHRYQFIKCDITAAQDVEMAFNLMMQKEIQPNVLVNNAGLDSPPDADAKENGPFEQYPEDSWDKVMSVNLKGPFLLCQAFGRNLLKNHHSGSIINISSIYGMVSPDQSLYSYRRTKEEQFFKPVAYSVSKSGIFNFTRYLAAYWADKSIRVNSLTIAGVFNFQDEKFLENYCGRIPIGRMAQPEDYVGALIFLASEASNYMTGSNLVVDGGWTAI